MLEIDFRSFKRADLVEVRGRVDTSNWQEFDSALLSLTSDGRYNIVVDLKRVEFMSSAGLRALVKSLIECTRHNGDLRLASPSKVMVDELEITGYDLIFSIFDDTISAIASF